MRNRIESARQTLGWSKQELARRSGVTRQTVAGIEDGDFAPTAAVALKLARALGQTVEELFWLEDELPTVEARLVCGAEPPAARGASAPLRVALADIGGRWVAHSLEGDEAFRTETMPADGVAIGPVEGATVSVSLLDAPERVARAVVLAGCTPALSLWARSAERGHPGLRVHWTHANSMAALDALLRGEVHGAGLHLYDRETGRFNAPFVRDALRAAGEPGGAVTLVNLGVWEEGLVVAPGNPLGIRSAADLAGGRLRVANREAGAGSRLILDDALEACGVPASEVRGYDTEALSHQEVARAVRGGQAEAGVTTSAMAALYRLGFVPLRAVRYDLAFRREYLALPSVRELLDTLGQRWVRSQLQMLGGYDTSRTGEAEEVE